MNNVRLEGTFTLRSPLSHIGESISASSYLVEESILQPNGEAEKVFAYSGNAWRGQLRDLMAAYMLDKLGRPELTLETFHLLFSGGRIGGAQSVDLEQARRMRGAIPMIALLGGGTGNQILQGKLRVGTCYPLCRESIPVLPMNYFEEACKVSYADCTMMKEYSRRDDSKIDDISKYLPAPERVLLASDKPAKTRKEESGVADQMRIRSELVIPGVKLRTWIAGQDLSDVQLGCLVSGIHRFSSFPSIGGQVSRGHGLVDLNYDITDLDTGNTLQFLRIENGASLLSPRAQSAKDSYDQHLRSLYDAMIASKDSEIKALLSGAA